MRELHEVEILHGVSHVVAPRSEDSEMRLRHIGSRNAARRRRRRVSGGARGWRTARCAGESYAISLPDESGDYRALVKKLVLGERGTCTRDVSPVDTYVADGGGGDNCTPGYDPCLVDHGGAD